MFINLNKCSLLVNKGMVTGFTRKQVTHDVTPCSHTSFRVAIFFFISLSAPNQQMQSDMLEGDSESRNVVFPQWSAPPSGSPAVCSQQSQRRRPARITARGESWYCVLVRHLVDSWVRSSRRLNITVCVYYDVFTWCWQYNFFCYFVVFSFSYSFFFLGYFLWLFFLLISLGFFLLFLGYFFCVFCYFDRLRMDFTHIYILLLFTHWVNCRRAYVHFIWTLCF